MPTLRELAQKHRELAHYEQLLSAWAPFRGRWPSSPQELGRGSLLYGVSLAFFFKGQTEYPDVDQVEQLLAALRQCAELDPRNEEQCEAALTRLDRLPGIGLARASTILHCLHPDDFPIVDHNAVNALCEWTHSLDWPRQVPSLTWSATKLTEDPRAYLEYRRILLALTAASNGELNLRQVEFALYNAGRTKGEEVTGI